MAQPLHISGGAPATATLSSVTVAAARPFVLLPAATRLHCVPSLPGPVLHTRHQTYHVLGRRRRHAPPRAPRPPLNPCRAAAGPGSGHQRGAHHTHLTLTVPLVDLLHIKDPDLPLEASGANAVLAVSPPAQRPGPQANRCLGPQTPGPLVLGPMQVTRCLGPQAPGCQAAGPRMAGCGWEWWCSAREGRASCVRGRLLCESGTLWHYVL